MADTSELAAVVLQTTMPNEQSAETLARRLVDERMIACANFVPGVRSIYRWNGEIRDEGEVLVLMKSSAERVELVQSRVHDLHPYDVPEILVLPFASGHRPYLDWITAQVTG